MLQYFIPPRGGVRDHPGSFLLTVSVQNIKGHIVNARNIDAHLEQSVTSSCLEELTEFPERFVTLFHLSSVSRRMPLHLQVDHFVMNVSLSLL